MSPPRGLSTHKLLAGASLLADSGADVINVADSPDGAHADVGLGGV